MRCALQPTSAALAVTGLLLVGSVPVLAQSGSRTYPPSSPGHRTEQPAPPALEGYCPVSILEMRQWVMGDPAHRVVYDGQTYLFADEQGKQMFQAEPAKYVPALGGDCMVAFAQMGRRVPGNIRHASYYGGRLLLFSNADAHQTFRAEPAKYANADLAYGGNCAVCREGLQRNVPGKPELTVVHKGLRYRFPSTDLRDEFLGNPARYEVDTSAGRAAQPATQPGSAPRQPAPRTSPRSPGEPGSGR